MRKQSNREDEEHVGLLIAAARKRIRQAVGRRAGVHGLTTQQFWVVVAVFEQRGLSLRELARRSRMDEPTASRVVAALVRRGWLRVQTDPGDRRRSRLDLGRTGERRGPGLHDLAAQIRRAVGEGISATERETLRRLLRKVIANMDRLHEGIAAPAARVSRAVRSIHARPAGAREPRRGALRLVGGKGSRP